MTTENQTPNYRIYDRTGSGVTHDIYAESLDAAIDAGREWMAEGDWEKDDMQTELDACVREIVRVPDLRSIDALPGVWGSGVCPDGSGILIVTVYDDALDTIIKSKMMPGPITQTIPDNDGSTILHVAFPNEIPTMIDEDATLDGDDHDCSYTLSAKDAPECKHAGSSTDQSDDQWHVWQSPFSLVGGIRENPGVWGSGHGRTKCTEVCENCGLYRTTDNGATNPSNGQRATRVSYQDADDRSEAWAAEQRGEWSAARVREYIAAHSDDDQLEDEDLEAAFRAVFGREPDDEDRESGLWSLLCAEL